MLESQLSSSLAVNPKGELFFLTEPQHHGLMLIPASRDAGRIPWLNPFAQCQAPGKCGLLLTSLLRVFSGEKAFSEGKPEA